jgi:hypothetical protein
MSNKQRTSNPLGNIDINSYRAYKNLLISGTGPGTGKNTIMNKSQKSNNPQNSIKKFFNFNINEENKQKQLQQNLTKSVFNSQSKRFLWQTDEKINRGSELTGSIKDRRNYELKSKNWQGLIFINQEENIINNNNQENKNNKISFQTPRKYFLYVNLFIYYIEMNNIF